MERKMRSRKMDGHDNDSGSSDGGREATTHAVVAQEETAQGEGDGGIVSFYASMVYAPSYRLSDWSMVD